MNLEAVVPSDYLAVIPVRAITANTNLAGELLGVVLAARKMDLTPEKQPRTKRVGRPPTAASKCNGYLQKQIIAAEAAVQQLKEAQVQLEEDNALQQPRLAVFDIGLKAADAHLSFLLISRCAFSRQTRAVLSLEDAKQVNKSQTHCALPGRLYSPKKLRKGLPVGGYHRIISGPPHISARQSRRLSRCCWDTQRDTISCSPLSDPSF